MVVTSEAFRSTVDMLLARTLSARADGDQEARIGREVGALPLGPDLDSAVFLRPDGTCVFVDQRTNEVEYQRSQRILVGLLVAGSARYEELAAFIPARPPGAPDCAVCAATGVGSYPSSEGRCLQCCGLGWDLDFPVVF